MLSRKPTNPVLDKSHPLARGLVASYTLNHPGAAFIFDYSGNARHGTGSSANWAMDAKEGLVWQFPSGTQQPVTFDESNRICGNAITTAFSVRCRYKCASLPASGSGIFGDSATEFAASLSTDGTSSLKVYTGTGNRYLSTYPKVTADNQWHDVVWTCDLATGYVRNYVDGVQFGTTSVTAGGSVQDVAQALDESYAANSDIQVSALEYWDRVLSAGEVLELHNIGAARHTAGVETYFALAASGPSGPAISIATNPNTSDVAPALFHFDASATTDATVTDPARDLDFYWIVTDDGTSEVMGSGSGCCYALVIDEPGSYTATLYVNNAEEGTSASGTVSLTVTDPDTVFSGTDTICLSISGDFTGAPSGASEVTVTDGDDIPTYLAANKRVLLRRGETFATTAVVELYDDEYLGAYGAVGSADSTGYYDNDPVMSAASYGVSIRGDHTKCAHIQIVADGAAGTRRGFITGVPGNHVNTVLHKCRVDGFYYGISVSDSLPAAYAVDIAADLAVSHCRVVPATTGTDYCAFVGANRLCLLSTVFEAGADGEHTVRIPYSHKLVMHRCNLGTNEVVPKHTFKLHHYAYGVGPTAAWADVATDICITENIIDNIGSDWAATIGPQNASSDERIDGVYWARNTHTSSDNQIALVVSAKGFKADNNQMLVSDWKLSGGGVGFWVYRSGIVPLSERARFYNNSMYAPESGYTSVVMFGVQESGYTGANAQVRNNCIGGDASDGTAVVWDGTNTAITGSNNLNSDESPDFVDAANGNFRLPALATQIDAGTAVPVYRDFRGFVRDASPDIGAYESEAGAEQVTDLTATKDGVDVDLAWLDLGIVDNYIAQRSPNGVDTWTQIATPTSPSATDTDPGTGTWYYRCAAVVDAVTGDWSDVASVTFAAAGTGGRKPLGLRPGRLL